MARYFPELEAAYPQADCMVLAVVETLFDTDAIVKMEFAEFIETVTRGKTIRVAQKQRLREIREAAHQSIGCALGEAAQWEAKVHVEQLRDIRAKIKENETRIQAAAEQFPEYQYLLSMPGFGLICPYNLAD